MDNQNFPLAPHHQNVLKRFIIACQEDEWVVAAFLIGSYAKGTADSFSDPDLYLFTTDEAYEAFCNGRATQMPHLLHEPYRVLLDKKNLLAQAALTILHFYQEVARPLAHTYNIPYPADLEQIMVKRLEQLDYAK